MSKAGKRAAKALKKIAEKVKELDYTRDALPCPACNAHEHIMCMDPDMFDMSCCCFHLKHKFEDVESTEKKERGGQIKGAEDITDVQSTGRKRAALLFPITEGMICEWASLKNAGGGVTPIIGCLGNKATDRHHGPDKNTLNNTDKNVHRICSFCHNYWHARNDEYYGIRPAGTEPFIPLDGHSWCDHDPVTKATTEEVIKAQLGRKKGKAKV